MCSQLHCDLPARPHAAPVHSTASAACNGSAAHAETRVSGGAAWRGDAGAAAGGSANGSNGSANGSRAGAGIRADHGAAGADLGIAEAVGMGGTGGTGGAQWFAGGGNCLLARQGPLLVEYDAAMRAPIGVVFIGIGALPAASSSAKHAKSGAKSHRTIIFASLGVKSQPYAENKSGTISHMQLLIKQLCSISNAAYA